MALRGLPKVKEATRIRVEQAARELGYTPHVAGVALARAKSQTTAESRKVRVAALVKRISTGGSVALAQCL